MKGRQPSKPVSVVAPRSFPGPRLFYVFYVTVCGKIRFEHIPIAIVPARLYVKWCQVFGVHGNKACVQSLPREGLAVMGYCSAVFDCSEHDCIRNVRRSRRARVTVGLFLCPPIERTSSYSLCYSVTCAPWKLLEPGASNAQTTLEPSQRSPFLIL